MPPPIYHETQHRWLCAKLQRPVFSQSDLDTIANELAVHTRGVQGFSWSNPHKSWWGLGNYDVNVLTLALEAQGFALSWLPRDADVRAFDSLKTVGLILHVQPRYFWNTAHWLAVRAIDGRYYNLDSKLDQPVVVGSVSEASTFDLQPPSDVLLVLEVYLGQVDYDQPTRCRAAASVRHSIAQGESHAFDRAGGGAQVDRRMTSRPPETMTTAAPDADTEEIRCVCGSTEDDGFTIQCDSCLVWQHAVCVNVKSNAIPAHYLCERCDPHRATRALGSPSHRDQTKSRRSRPDGGDDLAHDRRKRPKHRPKSPSAVAAPPSTKPTATKVSEYEAHLSYDPTNANDIGAASLTSNPSVHQYIKRVVSLRARKSEIRRRSSGSTPSDMQSLAPEDREQETILRNLSHLMTMDGETLNHPLYKVSVRTLSSPASPQSEKAGLFAESDIASLRFILKYKGRITLRDRYISLSENSYPLLGTAKPFVEFHPHFNLCVDARTHGNKARFIRRSCQPNAELRSVTLPGVGKHGMIHLAVFAKRDIPRTDEITIGWLWHAGGGEDGDANADALTFTAPDLTKPQAKALYRAFGSTPCACGRLADCAINGALRRHFPTIARMDAKGGKTQDVPKRSAGRPAKLNVGTADEIDLHASHGDSESRPSSTLPIPDDVPDLIDAAPSRPRSRESTPGAKVNGQAPGPISPPLSREERKLRDAMALFQKIEQKAARSKNRVSGNKRASMSPTATHPSGLDAPGTVHTDQRPVAPSRNRSGGFGRRTATATTKTVSFAHGGGDVVSGMETSSAAPQSAVDDSASDSANGDDSDYSTDEKGHLTSQDTSTSPRKRKAKFGASDSLTDRAVSRRHPRGHSPTPPAGGRKRSRASAIPDGMELEPIDVVNDGESPTPGGHGEGSPLPTHANGGVPQELYHGLKKFYVQCYLASAQANASPLPSSPAQARSPSPALDEAKPSVEAAEGGDGVHSSETESTIDVDTTDMHIDPTEADPKPVAVKPESHLLAEKPPTAGALTMRDNNQCAHIAPETASPLASAAVKQEPQTPELPAVSSGCPTVSDVATHDLAKPLLEQGSAPASAKFASKVKLSLSQYQQHKAREKPSAPPITNPDMPPSQLIEPDAALPTSTAIASELSTATPPASGSDILSSSKDRELLHVAREGESMDRQQSADQPCDAIPAPTKLPQKTRMSLKEYANLKRKGRLSTPGTPISAPGHTDGFPLPVVPGLQSETVAKRVETLVSAASHPLTPGSEDAKRELQSIISRELSGIIAPDVISRMSTPTGPGTPTPRGDDDKSTLAPGFEGDSGKATAVATGLPEFPALPLGSGRVFQSHRATSHEVVANSDAVSGPLSASAVTANPVGPLGMFSNAPKVSRTTSTPQDAFGPSNTRFHSVGDHGMPSLNGTTPAVDHARRLKTPVSKTPSATGNLNADNANRQGTGGTIPGITRTNPPPPPPPSSSTAR
ncbi:SET domain-containing protein 3 [Dimargaris xerosporica]|nr:SET domain-containing protein 3 [Dimargaris xerosporica]